MAEDGQSNDQMLQELDALSHTMYQSHSRRRTTSLALPRSTGDANAGGSADSARAAARPVSRRMSMSPFRSRPKLDKIEDGDYDDDDDAGPRVAGSPFKSQSFAGVSSSPSSSVAKEKKGIWGWRPIRALSRIGMQRMGCLFSVEVVTAQGLPPTMHGLRLVVAVRKKETRDGAVQTMPARVQHGAADFEETLFVRCNLYCGGGGAGGKPLRLEPRPFLVSAVAMDAPELDLGRNAVDLSRLVMESVERSRQGERVRQWDMAFPLAGKAKGGELVVKLAFQVMDDGGVALYGQTPGAAAVAAGRTGSSSSSSLLARKQSDMSFSIASPKVTRAEAPPLTPPDMQRVDDSSSSSSSLFARQQSKTSFSIASPKVTRSEASSLTPTAKGAALSPDLQRIDDFKLDEPSPVAEVKQEQEKEPEEVEVIDDSEFPEFDVVDKGVEEQEEQKDEPKEDAEDKKEEAETKTEEEKAEEEEVSSAAGDEVVKEVVLDTAHTWRLSELEAITNQIKALESMMHAGDVSSDAAAEPAAVPLEDEALGLDADEVTREFLQLLEQEEDIMADASAKPRASSTQQVVSSLKSGAKPGSGADATCYISDLGKGLGHIVQTRDGGYLAATNPFDIPVARKELPKLAMHLSKPFLLQDQKLPLGGAELFQRLCAGGSEALLAKLGALVAMEDVVGKTAEQIAFEGMATAIVSARSKELVVASSSAAQSVSLLRTMSAAMSRGREDRINTGIWNAQEAPVAVDEILAFSLQKIEMMAVEALKVQADMASDLGQSPFEVSPAAAAEKPEAGHLLDTAAPPEEWAIACVGADTVALFVVVQLRDPMRRYEPVGAPSIVIVQARRAGGGGDDVEPKFKVTNMHLGGLRLKSADRRSVWDGEKQRLTAMHWLVAYGLGKADRKSRAVAAAAKAGQEVLWSMSSRVMADMWLRPIRNPDVKLNNK